LIEACAVGKPVLIGPHTYNFAQATEMAVACGAAAQIRNADALMQQLSLLLHDAEHLKRMSEAGLQFVNQNQGATERAMMLIEVAFDA
jgi:3-deoxy-D-manno-octulosonic-acid transferase